MTTRPAESKQLAQGAGSAMTRRTDKLDLAALTEALLTVRPWLRWDASQTRTLARHIAAAYEDQIRLVKGRQSAD